MRSQSGGYAFYCYYAKLNGRDIRVKIPPPDQNLQGIFHYMVKVKLKQKALELLIKNNQFL